MYFCNRLLIATILVAASAGAVFGDETNAAVEATTSGEVRDVILMLDDGPLHFRFHIGLKGESLPQLRQRYVERLMATLDKNKDDRLSQEEAQHSPLLRKKQRADAESFLNRLGGARYTTIRDVRQTVERVGGETVVYRQELTTSNNDAELFRFLDANESGTLDKEEILSARFRIRDKDLDGDEAISFQEILPPPDEPEQPVDQPFVIPEVPQRSTVGVATLMRDARETLLPRRIVRRYDKDFDRRLSAEELNWTPELVATLDRDRDGMLDDRELRNIRDTPVDLELRIDLDPTEPTVAPVTIVSSTGKTLDITKRPDLVKIQFSSAVITFARRWIDPMATALENAVLEFNLLDGDANGYLDRNETEERIRFTRGLFEMIDNDRDDKIFAEELKEYVQLRGEPSITSCRVNLYDSGHGFFVALDSNADGRIGVRERMQAARALALMDRDGEIGLSADEPVKHYHVEFVRGTYQLFGAAEEPSIRTSGVQSRTPVGPPWFQAMDRNGDGDVSWREFLGPADSFQQLDQDLDNLIDPREAARAAELFK